MTSTAVPILPQPDDTTCGPTCLHAVYGFYGDDVPLERIIAEVAPLPEGGTLAVDLARHALRRGYHATIYTYNLQLFDPSWFAPTPRDLVPLLEAQAAAKPDPKLALATASYVEYLALGGAIEHQALTGDLLAEMLGAGQPVLTGLSATYLYGCAREFGDDYDDVRGAPTGHFVVLQSYDAAARSATVADPYRDNPRWESHHYSVTIDRLIGAILLGVVTYDANLLVIRPV